MKKTALIASALFLASINLCFSESASQIEKARRDIEMEKILRDEAVKGRKVLIKKITVRGVNLLTKERIKDITLPFKGRWLSQADIKFILDSIHEAYNESGYVGQPDEMTFRIQKRNLRIDIKEGSVKKP